VELGRQGLLPLGIDLVGHDHHGLGRPAERSGQGAVLLLHAGRGVDYQQDQVGLPTGPLGLPGHAGLDPPGLLHEPAGVDQDEGPPAP
jgi:hypothetical protein